MKRRFGKVGVGYTILRGRERRDIEKDVHMM